MKDSPAGLTGSALALAAKYGTVALSVEQLAAVIHWSEKGIQNAISSGDFPIPTFKAGRVRMAHVRHVADYLDSEAERGAQEWAATRKRMQAWAP